MKKTSDIIPNSTKRLAKIEDHPELFRQVLEASGVAMAIRAPSLRPIFANHAFTDFYGYEIAELQEVPAGGVLPEKTQKLYKETIIPAIEVGESWEGEYVIRTRAGRLHSVWGRFDPVQNCDGELTHVISVMRDSSSSRRLRNALNQTERHLNFLTENTSDCLFRMRLSDRGYDYISPAVESITGYSPQEFYEKSVLVRTLTPPEWREAVETWWQELVEGRNRYEYEWPLMHKDGSLRWVNQRITIVTDDNDLPIAVEGIATDVTDRREVQDELAVAQKSLNFISSSTSDIFFRLTIPDGTYDYLSPSVERFSGYSVHDYEDNPLFIRQIFHPAWKEYFNETWEELCNGHVRSEYEFQYIHKSGDVRWANQRVVLEKDEDGNPVAIEGIATDVTERKRAEEALKESEAKYRLLIETLEDVIWAMDNDYNYLYVSPSIESLTGYTPDEYRAMGLEETMTPESLATVRKMSGKRREAEAQGVFDTVNRFEVERLRKGGGTVWVESIIRRMLSANGEPVGYLGISRDISPRREAELAMQESENRFRVLFEESPISLWEEDLTRLKLFFDELKMQGVTDFRKYFYDHPEELGKCALLVDVVSVNKATLDLLGARDKEELLGNLDKVLTESSMAAFTEEMILLASGGCEYCGEITHRTLDGEEIWVVVHFLVPPEYQDTLSRVIVSLIDVTPRKRAEERLMESEERYRVLVENSQEGVVVSMDGKAVYINEAMTDIFGCSVDDLKKIHPLEMVHPDDKARAMTQMEGYVSGKRKEAFASFRIVTRNNRTKWLTLHVKPILWNGMKAQLEILTDVTIYKTLEDELRAAHSEMENRVTQRTAELSQANIQLTCEAQEREKAQEHILSLTQQLMRIQEDERQRISRDLHDNVAQDLSSIVLKLETLFDGFRETSPEVRGRTEDLTSIVQGSIASVRDIAYGLSPSALEQLGLARALENLCGDAARRTGVDIEFFATGIENIQLDFDVEINIYRMIQEAINNMGKHAQAARCTVRLVQSHPDILIRIEDNGNGFVVAQRIAEAVEERRMGLKSMEERARLIGGSMEIQSLVGSGTRIIFKIPIADARRQ